MRKERLRKNLLLGAVTCFMMLHSLAWAAPSMQGKRVGVEPMAAVLMEDHSDAFVAWRQSSFKKRTVVHIDSHLDVEWISPSDLKRISNSKTVEALRQIQTDPFHPEERSSKPLSILNYLYAAMMEGMVKELYWVTPDSLMAGTAVLDKVKSHLIGILSKLSIDDLTSFRLQKGVVKGKVFGIPLSVCKLSDLPRFNEPVLLDIDVDYFDPPDLGKRMDIPSLWPGDLITSLTKNGIKTDSVTICYSVKGGYLALEYKFLGNELAEIFGDPMGNDPLTKKVRECRRSGHIYRSKGMYPEAIEEFQKGLELNPKDAGLHYGMGLIYSQWGKPLEASAEFTNATALDSLYRDPSLFDADYYLQKEIYDKALPLYEAVLQGDPKNLKALLGASLSSSKLEMWEKAEEYYQRVIQRAPDFDYAHFNRGAFYAQRAQWEKEEAEYRQTVELTPTFGKAYQNLGILYTNRGEIGKAIWAYEKTIENNPCFKGAQNNLGSLYARIGKYDEAVRCFKNAVRIDPRYGAGFSNLGKVYLLQEKGEDALKAFQQALAIEPKNPWPRYYLGRVYASTGRTPDAVKAYEQVIAVDQNFYPAYLDLARILGEREADIGRAVMFARKAVEVNPTAEAYALLAWLYSKRGRDEEADEAIHRALQLDPNNESLIRLRDSLHKK